MKKIEKEREWENERKKNCGNYGILLGLRPLKRTSVIVMNYTKVYDLQRYYVSKKK